MPPSTETEASFDRSLGFRIGVLRVEPHLNRLGTPSGERQLEPKVMQVLVCLAGRPGEVLTRQELMDAVWPDTIVGEQVLSRAVSELRKAFDDDSRSPRTIETIAKRGYRLIAPVTPLETVAASPASVAGEPSLRAYGTPVALGLVLVGIALGAAIAAWILRPETGDAHSRGVPRAAALSLALLLPEDAPPLLGSFQSLALSPDGERLVYTSSAGGRLQLWTRRLDRDEATPVPGTEGGFGPFFSADGRWLGFYAAGSMKRVPVEGGEAVTLWDDASDPQGATWLADGTIVFTRRLLEGLRMIPAGGGAPRPLTTVDRAAGEGAHMWPHVLPDGDSVLFTVWRGGGMNRCDIDVVSIASGERRSVLRGGSHPRYAAGHLVYAHTGTILAVPFDVAALEVRGTPVPRVENVATHPVLGAAHFEIAADGTLVFAESTSARDRALRWRHPDGELEPVGGVPDGVAGPVLSPDVRSLAATRSDPDLQLWIYDLERGGGERVDSEGGSSLAGVWSPAGDRLVFTSDREGAYDLWVVAAAELAAPRRLTRSANFQYASSWSPDGKTVAYSEFHPDTRWDVHLVDVAAESAPTPLLDTPFDEFGPVFSPDGRLIAYVSNESGRWDASGRWEVYVRPRDRPALRIRASNAGGTNPLWSRDGTTLYYREEDRIMAVALEREGELQAAAPRALYAGLELPPGAEHEAVYGVARDGRFLVVVPAVSQRRAVLRVETGWAARLAR